jgi:RHS repeat-associated protein
MTQQVTAAVATTRSGTDPDHVVVSGWTQYNNKGEPVRQYEPFYATGWDYDDPVDTAPSSSVFVEMHYDARGRVVETLHPDGSKEEVVFGVPGTITAPDLSTPDVSEPTPWERYAYGRNDLAGSTHPTDSTGYAEHYNTPASMTVDAMGRVVEAVARNHQTDANEWFVTKTSYDIRGNVLTVTDPLDRVCAVQLYDLAGRSLRTESIDAGTSWIAFDAAGQPRQTRDPRGACIWTNYDTKMRQTHQWACSSATEDVGLRVHMVYGDGASGPSSPQATNHNDRVWKQYDETGRCVFESYDFKGNLEENTRRVVDPQHLIDANRSGTSGNNWEITPWETDWTWDAGSGETLGDRENTLLDGTDYRTSTTYDALSRPTAVTHPLDVKSERKVTTPTYNRAGALEKVSFDGAVYIDRIAYNARGERILLALENGVMTRYVHDRNTGRLRRLRSEQYTVNGSGDYVPSGNKFQDNGYAYDLSGNILGILDRSEIGAQSGMANTSSSTTLVGYPFAIPTTNTFLKRYTYDPTGRLLTADGAEHGTRTIADPWSDLNPKVQDLSAIDAYTESYTYDANGSMTALNHAGNVTYARQFAVESTSNRLTSLTQGSTTYSYVFDDAGQMTQENTERHFGWNHAGRLRDFRNQVAGSQASVSAHYLYGPDGERRVKVVSKQTGPDIVTLYVEGGFEHRERRDTGGTTTNEEYQIGGKARTARLRVGTAFANDSSPAGLHFLQDHLGSVSTTVQADGSFFSREEYTPYGESAYGSFTKKRYRLNGDEKDEETSLYLQGERYFHGSSGTWISSDPAGLVETTNLFAYCLRNPIRFVDPGGRNSEEHTFLRFGRSYIGTPYWYYCSDKANDSSNPKGRQLGPDYFDCSGFVNYVVEQTTGFRPGGGAKGIRNALVKDPRFVRVDPANAQPGDIIYEPGHIGFIADNEMANGSFSMLHSEGWSTDKETLQSARLSQIPAEKRRPVESYRTQQSPNQEERFGFQSGVVEARRGDRGETLSNYAKKNDVEIFRYQGSYVPHEPISAEHQKLLTEVADLTTELSRIEARLAANESDTYSLIPAEELTAMETRRAEIKTKITSLTRELARTEARRAVSGAAAGANKAVTDTELHQISDEFSGTRGGMGFEVK